MFAKGHRTHTRSSLVTEMAIEIKCYMLVFNVEQIQHIKAAYPLLNDSSINR